MMDVVSQDLPSVAQSLHEREHSFVRLVEDIIKQKLRC